MIETNQEIGVTGGVLVLISRTDTTSFLSKIKVPTLILAGEEDPIALPSVAQRMKDQISGSTLQVISGAGHFTPIENSKDFNFTLVKFLNSCLLR